ncbi:hypothetical protein A4E84_29725 [Streptomyces qaidamensis]|uniref:Uncharacterized protein n=1 Tax=Streptomyces qaidamensis TaxID=1783515 RepID=A0A143C793_9ACTN|nr:hypothetical protein [Streptomyces qaidamensis]AMW13307.1 hypothetical protein A4E84_29725 [Streptomyces qaidamensis]
MDDSLSFESFFKGAKKAAHRAMDDHARREYDEFALHAGVAIERLAKAILVKMNPLYIASGKVAVVAGQKQFAIHTITMSEALKRLAHLDIVKMTQPLQTLIEQRNGTVHASGDDAAKNQIPTLVTTIAAMLKHLGTPIDDFWGRWTSAVNVAVDKQRNEIQRDVEIRIKQARHLFEDRFQRLPPELKEHAVSLEPHVITAAFDYLVEIDGKMHPSSIMTPGGPCPSCTAQTTLLFGMVDRSADHTQYAPDGISCHVCGLSLGGFDEMAALRDILGPSNEAYEQLRTEALSAFFGRDSDTD